MEDDDKTCLEEKTTNPGDTVSIDTPKDLPGGCFRRRRSSENDPPSLSLSSVSNSKRRRNDPQCLPRSVSSWTRLCTERLGIFYNNKAAELTDFYTLSERSFAFDYPLKEENKRLLETLVQVTEEKMAMSRKLNWSVTEEATQWFPFLEESARCQDILSDLHVIAEKKEDWSTQTVQYLRRSHYKIEEFFMQLQKMYLKRKDGKNLTESDFTELLAGFTKIFFINVEEALSERKMKIGNSMISSIPGLCFWAQYPSPLYSVAVVTVAEGNSEEMKEAGKHNSYDISAAVSNRVLGQHAGELLLEVGNSVFRNVTLGIICIQTMIIFTYLKISRKHLALIEEKGEIDCRLEINGKRSGIIHYTKPYDFMEEKDRCEILEFLFWIGLHSLPVDYRLNPVTM